MVNYIRKKIKNYFSSYKINPEEGIALTTGIIMVVILATTILGGILFWEKILTETVKAFLTIIIAISGPTAALSAKIFELTGGSTLLNSSITNDPIVMHGWGIVRDLTNMLIVLGFVVVGIATALRIRNYQAKKTLLPLIIVALLVNFSLLMSGLVIDATNLTMAYFLEKSGPAGVTEPFLSALSNPAIEQELKDLEEKDEMQYIAARFSQAAFFIVVAIVFFIFAILFLFRYVALMALVTLAPLAFFSYVFYATKPIFKKWWNNFFQWSIIGIPAVFFVYLAGHLIDRAITNATEPEQVFTLGFLVPIAFLLFAYTLCFQSSAIGASAAVGLAGATAGLAWGATKFAGGKVLKKTGREVKESKWGKETRKWIEKQAWLPGKIGGVTQKERGKIQEASKQAAGMTATERGQTLAGFQKKGRAWTPSGKVEYIGTAEKAAEQGDEISDRTIADMRSFQQAGYAVDVDKFAKTNPIKAPDLKPDRVKYWEGQINPTTGSNYKTSEARQKVIRETVEKQSRKSFTDKVHASSFEEPGGAHTDEHLATFYGMDFEKAKDYGQKASTKDKTALHNLVRDRIKDISQEIIRLRTGSPADKRQAKELIKMNKEILSY